MITESDVDFLKDLLLRVEGTAPQDIGQKWENRGEKKKSLISTLNRLIRSLSVAHNKKDETRKISDLSDEEIQILESDLGSNTVAKKLRLSLRSVDFYRSKHKNK